MDCRSDPATISHFPIARKKRSNFHRRPHPDPKPITNYLNVITQRSSPTDYGGLETINLHCSNGNLRMGADFECFNAPCGDHKSDAAKQGVSDRLGNENKLRKLKLKLGGVTRTLHTTPTIGVNIGSDSSVVSGAHLKQERYCDAKEKFSRRHMDQNSDVMYKMGHKSRRATKKFAVDEDFDDEDDEEIRYLKKLRASKVASGHVPKQGDTSKKIKGISIRMNVDYSATRDGSKKSRIYKLNDDYEMELSSDDELKGNRKRLTGDSVDPAEREMTMTTRKRALECPESGGLVEYPNGLPSAPSKKQKLSEVEQQLRKAEAAQRRRLQAEKAAKEAEADAIRKILGQDSSRKKEEKLKKQQEALAQEKMGRSAALGPNTVRWIMGPKGTVVTFSEDMGIPKILHSMPCRYPPPREKCVGPNCTNEYKYRDSKSKLPLCSLHCYKAVRGNMELLPAC
ncbi:Prominin-2 [Bienertia sinuspersici]